MKQVLSLLLLLALSMSHIGLSVQASAYRSNAEWFSSALTADGEKADAVAEQLYGQFILMPDDFLNDLEIADTKTQKAVSQLLFYGCCALNQENTFRQILSNSNTTYAAILLEQFCDYLVWLQQFEAAENQNSTGHIDAFHPETIRGFIDASFESTDPYADTEFCQRVAVWYHTDPVLFAKTLQGYEKEKITRIAYQIAYAAVKKQVEIPKISTIEKETWDNGTGVILNQLQNDICNGMKIQPFAQVQYTKPHMFSATAALYIVLSKCLSSAATVLYESSNPNL